MIIISSLSFTFFCTEFMIIAHVEEGGSKTVGVNEIYVMKAYRTNNEN